MVADWLWPLALGSTWSVAAAVVFCPGDLFVQVWFCRLLPSDQHVYTGGMQGYMLGIACGHPGGSLTHSLGSYEVVWVFSQLALRNGGQRLLLCCY